MDAELLIWIAKMTLRLIIGIPLLLICAVIAVIVTVIIIMAAGIVIIQLLGDGNET